MKNLPNFILTILAVTTIGQAGRFRSNPNRANIFVPDSLDVSLNENIRIILNDSFVKILDLPISDSNDAEEHFVALESIDFSKLYENRQFSITTQSDLISKIKQTIKKNIKAIAEEDTLPTAESIFASVKEFVQYQLYTNVSIVDLQLEALYFDITEAVKSQLDELLEALRRRATWISTIQMKAAYEFDEQNQALKDVRESVKTFLVSGVKFYLQQALNGESPLDEFGKSKATMKIFKIVKKIRDFNRDEPLSDVPAELDSLITELYEQKTHMNPGEAKEMVEEVLSFLLDLIDPEARPGLIAKILKTPYKRFTRNGQAMPGLRKFRQFLSNSKPNLALQASYLTQIDKFNLLDQPLPDNVYEDEQTLKQLLARGANALYTPYLFAPFEFYDTPSAPVFDTLYDAINELRDENINGYTSKPEFVEKLIAKLKSGSSNCSKAAAILVINIAFELDLPLSSDDVQTIDLNDPAIIALQRYSSFDNLISSLMVREQSNGSQTTNGKTLIREKIGRLNSHQINYLESSEAIAKLLKDNSIDLSSFLGSDGSNEGISVFLINPTSNVCYQQNIVEFFSNKI